MTAIRIAIVQALDGHLTCVGPNDFDGIDYRDAMSAALGWHLEAGHLPGASYWATVELPLLPAIPEVNAKAMAVALPADIAALSEDDAA